jgi:hypothetical protein
MNINESKFICTEYDSYGSYESYRRLSGKITKQRRKAIEKIVRTFNHKWDAPYGVSPNGYAYRCGHIHDCCGCLVSKGMSVEFKKLGKSHVAVLTIYESFNL